MSKPTIQSWLNGLANEGFPSSIKGITFQIDRDGQGWMLSAFGYSQISKEKIEGIGEPYCISGEYPLEIHEQNTPQMEAVFVGRSIAEYLKLGTGREKFLSMDFLNVLDSDLKLHKLYEKEGHAIHDPASMERRMTFLMVLSLLAVLLPSFDPTMAIFGILLGGYGLFLTKRIFKKHRKARCAFVLDLIALALGLLKLAFMMFSSNGGAL